MSRVGSRLSYIPHSAFRIERIPHSAFRVAKPLTSSLSWVYNARIGWQDPPGLLAEPEGSVFSIYGQGVIASEARQSRGW